MIYIYDILLNFSENLYSFYEWNTEYDNIRHFKKIPMFRIDSDFISIIFNNKVKLDNSFVKLLKGKSYEYDGELINRVNNICILSDTYEAIAVLLDEEGNIINRSRLYIEDEIEILELSTNIKSLIIDYEVKEKINYEIKYRLYENINNKLNNIVNNIKDNELISYLGYDWFNKDNVSKVELKRLINDSDMKNRIKYLESINSIYK